MKRTLPIDTTGLTGYALSIAETLNKLGDQYSATFYNNIQINLLKYCLFNHYTDFEIEDVIDVTNGKKQSRIAIIKLSYFYIGKKGHRYHETEYQAWGIAALRNNFGHVLIKPESIKDKIIELINPVELDFEDDLDFSSRFYVLASDKDKALNAMNFQFRNAVAQISDSNFCIEIIGNKLVVGNRKVVSPTATLILAEFLNRIT